MTKETRIGLLVGLMFIVMFGLVLTELTGTTWRAPVAQPAPSQDVGAYAHTPVIEDAAPAGGVMNGGDGAGRAPGEAADAGAIDEGVVESALASRGVHEGLVESEIRPRRTVLAATGPGAGGVAARAGDPPPAGRRTYKVQPNDTLYKVARQVYGPGNEKHYRLILEANRSLIRNEDLLLAGTELVIPPAPSAGPATPSGSDRAPWSAPAVRPSEPRVIELAAEDLRRHLAAESARDTAGGPPREAATQPGREIAGAGPREPGREAARQDARDPSRDAVGGRAARTHVVQRGDNLSKIARRILKDDSPATLRKLYNANRDRLDSPDHLPVGVELQIPS